MKVLEKKGGTDITDTARNCRKKIPEVIAFYCLEGKQTRINI